MSYLRLVYDDTDPTSTMLADCGHVALRLTPTSEVSARPTHGDKVKREMTVDEAAVRLAAAIDLGRG